MIREFKTKIQSDSNYLLANFDTDLCNMQDCWTAGPAFLLTKNESTGILLKVSLLHYLVNCHFTLSVLFLDTGYKYFHWLVVEDCSCQVFHYRYFLNKNFRTGKLFW